MTFQSDLEPLKVLKCAVRQMCASWNNYDYNAETARWSECLCTATTFKGCDIPKRQMWTRLQENLGAWSQSADARKTNYSLKNIVALVGKQGQSERAFCPLLSASMAASWTWLPGLHVGTLPRPVHSDNACKVMAMDVVGNHRRVSPGLASLLDSERLHSQHPSWSKSQVSKSSVPCKRVWVSAPETVSLEWLKKSHYNHAFV